jgi:hypothetical protein
MHNTLIWKCPVCQSTSQKGEEFASEERLQQSLIEHMQLHPEIDKNNQQNLARVSGIPKPRPVDKCPICLDDNQPERREEETHQGKDNPVEEASKPRESTKLQPSDRKKGVEFTLPDDSESHSEDDDTVKPASRARAKQQGHRRSTQDSDHERLEKHISQHLRALAFYFSNRLLRDMDRESDAPLGSTVDSSLLDLSSLSNPDSDNDPPQLPVATELFDNDLDTDERKEQVAIVESNLKELSFDWGSDRRPPEPSMAPEELQRMFPDTSYHRNDDLWKPLSVEYALAYAALVLIILELCQAIPERQNWSASEGPLYSDLEIFSFALRGFHGDELKAGSQSDFILASTLINV